MHTLELQRLRGITTHNGILCFPTTTHHAIALRHRGHYCTRNPVGEHDHANPHDDDANAHRTIDSIRVVTATTMLATLMTAMVAI